MPVITFDSFTVVAAVAFLVPLVLGFAPRLRVPSIVLEIVAGFAIGPHGFGWATVDPAVYVFSVVGLDALLFLAGFEFDWQEMRGLLFGSVARGFLLSCGLALICAFGLTALHVVTAPLVVATILASTSLGLVVPILKDAGEERSELGKLVIAGCTLGEIGPLIFLSVVFATGARDAAVHLGLLIGLVAFAALLGLVIWKAQRISQLSTILRRLENTSSQLRIRGVGVLLAVIGLAAYHIGFETILGAFLAGAILALVLGVDLKQNELFRHKLDGIAYGVFVPFFFISSGMQLDIGALFAHASALAKVPVFLIALLVVRGLPAVLYRGEVGPRQLMAAGLLQATSLSFIVVATEIAQEAGMIDATNSVALVAAGLLSALIYPLAALVLMGNLEREPEPEIGEALA